MFTDKMKQYVEGYFKDKTLALPQNIGKSSIATALLRGLGYGSEHIVWAYQPQSGRRYVGVCCSNQLLATPQGKMWYRASVRSVKKIEGKVYTLFIF